MYMKMKDIKNKFALKALNGNKNFYFLYNGDKIREELNFYEQANDFDKDRKKMNILVCEKEEENNINDKKIKSKEVICSDCGENIFIKFKDNKIDLYECKNGHSKYNILYEEFENIQKIDLSEINCDKCKESTRDNTYNNEFYICNTSI